MRRLVPGLAVAFLGCVAIPANLNAQGVDAERYLDAQNAKRCFNRAKYWEDKGEYDKAIAAYTEAIRIGPNHDEFYTSRGEAWRHKGEYDKAIADFNQAVAINPKDAAAPYNNLAWLYATCPDEKHRDGKKAVENANKAYRLTEGKNCGCIDTLAAAYAESGDFQKAKDWEVKVIEMAATDTTATDDNRAEARVRMELYKQGKPYREELRK